jgi:protein TonB
MQDRTLLFSISAPQPSLARRLFHEFTAASRDFRRDPKAYFISAIRGEGFGGYRRKMLLEYGLAIALLLYSGGFLILLTIQTIRANRANTDESSNILQIIHLSPTPRPPDEQAPAADKDQSHDGRGGGGHNQNDPASGGELPSESTEQPTLAPTTKPTLKPPDLPVQETLLSDQNLKRDDLKPTGLPDANIAPPSDGPGSDGGVGTGKHGGIGDKDRPGYGPGKDGVGPGGDDSPTSRRHDANEAVDTKPIPLNRPRPNYTELARQHKVQGIVRVRVLVGADGLVKQVRIIGAGLTDGLNEEAIRAASQMRFQPATRSGQAVAHWVSIEIEFNIR